MRGRKIKALLLGAMLAVGLTGCGSSDYSKNAATDSYYYDTNGNNMAAGSTEGIYYEQGSAAESTITENGESVREGRKLIRTVYLDVETMEFDGLLSYVKNKTDELGGYVEKMEIYNGSSYYTYSYRGTGYTNNRDGSLVLRIPKDKLDGFLTGVEDNSNITSRTEEERDVTLDYVDLDSHKAVLLAEQESLISLMEQAENIEDIIVLESRLSEIRYQIESMESQLRTYDNQIDYSTVYLTITEVVELTPVEPAKLTTWERIRDGFTESVENIGIGFKEFFIAFVIALPYLVLLAVFALIVLAIVLFFVKRSNEKQKKAMEQAEKYRMAGQQTGSDSQPPAGQI